MKTLILLVVFGVLPAEEKFIETADYLEIGEVSYRRDDGGRQIQWIEYTWWEGGKIRASRTYGVWTNGWPKDEEGNVVFPLYHPKVEDGVLYCILGDSKHKSKIRINYFTCIHRDYDEIMRLWDWYPWKERNHYSYYRFGAQHAR